MKTDRRTLEQIVAAAVEKHLAGGGAAPVPSPAPASSPTTKTTNGQPLYLSEAVITADLLEEALNGSRSFQVSTAAILTPSAHDVIRQRGLQWSRSNNGAVQSAANFLATVVTAGAAVSAATSQLAESWKTELLESPSSAARAAVSSISRGEHAGVAVISDKPQLAATLANRSPKVRAAVARNSEEVEAAISEMGVNVICVDPKGQNSFGLKRMLQRFSQSPPQEPVDWETTSRLW